MTQLSESTFRRMRVSNALLDLKFVADLRGEGANLGNIGYKWSHCAQGRGSRMTIRVVCECGHEMLAKDEFAGRRIKCRSCESPLTIPEPRPRKQTRDGSVRKRRRPAEAYEDQPYDEDGYDEYIESQPPRRKPKRKGKKRKRSRGRPAWLIPAIAVTVAVAGVGALGFFLVVKLPEMQIEAEIANRKPEDLGGYIIDLPGEATEDGRPIVANTDHSHACLRSWHLTPDGGEDLLAVQYMFFDVRSQPRDATRRAVVKADSAVASLDAFVRGRAQSNGGEVVGATAKREVNGIQLARCLMRSPDSSSVALFYSIRDGAREIRLTTVSDDTSQKIAYFDRMFETLRKTDQSVTLWPGPRPLLPSELDHPLVDSRSLPDVEADFSEDHRFKSVEDCFPSGTHPASVYEIYIHPRLAPLNELIAAGGRRNAHWLRQHVESAPKGQPLPYDPKLGLTRPEYEEMLALGDEGLGCARALQLRTSHPNCFSAGPGWECQRSIRATCDLHNILARCMNHWGTPARFASGSLRDSRLTAVSCVCSGGG